MRFRRILDFNRNLCGMQQRIVNQAMMNRRIYSLTMALAQLNRSFDLDLKVVDSHRWILHLFCDDPTPGSFSSQPVLPQVLGSVECSSRIPMTPAEVPVESFLHHGPNSAADHRSLHAGEL